MENEVLERCYNDAMPSGRCTLPRGHQGYCVSPAEAERDRLREALERIASIEAIDRYGTNASLIARETLAEQPFSAESEHG